jgi:CRP-like cAMP-binding protein
MTDSAIETALREHALLAGMRDEHLALLAGCAATATFDRGHFLLCEGKPAESFYLIVEGEVAIEIPAGDIGPVMVQKLHAGELVGWSWMVEPYTWNFDALALSTIQAIAFDGVRLRELCAEDTDLGYELTKRLTAVITGRLRAARVQLVEKYL